MSRSFSVVALATLTLTTSLAFGVVPALAADHGTEWSYSGATGPEHWGSLDPAYAACSDGKEQSPINITKTAPDARPNPVIRYEKGKATLEDNGHSINVSPNNSAAPSVMILNGKKYELSQFHFHAPSEHMVDGKRYPLEVHFVNKAADGSLAVLGIFVKEGSPAVSGWPKVIANIDRARTDGKAETVLPFDWNRLIPSDRQTLRYDGSLTTPPCTEGVKWNLISTPITMSADQIDSFRKAYDGHNRPVQPLHGRVVWQDTSSR